MYDHFIDYRSTLDVGDIYYGTNGSWELLNGQSHQGIQFEGRAGARLFPDPRRGSRNILSVST
jgi:hypothetical protein